MAETTGVIVMTDGTIKIPIPNVVLEKGRSESPVLRCVKYPEYPYVVNCPCVERFAKYIGKLNEHGTIIRMCTGISYQVIAVDEVQR